MKKVFIKFQIPNNKSQTPAPPQAGNCLPRRQAGNNQNKNVLNSLDKC